ncbi:hypothetical protein MKW92_024281, partial [Papaver armeniacum]
MINWCQSVGKKNHIVVIIRKSHQKPNDKGSFTIFTCERLGLHVEKIQNNPKVIDQHKKRKRRVAESKKCGYPFELRGSCVDGVKWIVRVKNGSHNHLVYDNLTGHPYPGRLTPKDTDLCIALSLSGNLYSPNYLSSLFISDDDQHLQNGLAEVFSEATNILCAFHIKRNVCANFKTGMNKDTPEDLEKIKGDWDALWMSESCAMYKIHLDCVERSWGNKYPKWISYVKTQWLARKDKFVCAWTNQIKHFGNRTTNRVEGEHAILKKFLKCSTRIFLKCWQDMNNAWLTRGIKIRASFEKSKNIGLHEHCRSPYIKHLVYHVSRTALDFISMEIKSLSKRDPGRCQHLIHKTHGLPCA